ncbi:TPA: hypothetical protein ACR8QZ_003875 [Enterobacter roggenkampii]|uniref:hypothetical protein n=1 Tax=Enterobacter TaxID=547 RepID=UPI0006650611|nr:MULTISPECIES: hypothetical protein [Enterobacter]MDU2079058.1 hypothetical protein [Enterobacter sp.]HCM9127876.1 hypothetical protein [Enterobacter asburiae]HED1589913.1 hypothetical protein [Enterobacter asburiae]HED2713863.1 hypothetical protein [Enterobacter asburiae]HED3276621.1 hypothetical protein [Enterobacter asburiae]
MKLSTYLTVVLLLPTTAFCSMETIYAEQNGTCTKDTCIKGDRVSVYSTKDDSGYAQSSSGDAIELERLKKATFNVAGQDDKCDECAIVTSPGGEKYSIQRMFLKRTD